MEKDSIYYDGPIEITGRSEEELEQIIEEEKKKMENMEWPEEYNGI